MPVRFRNTSRWPRTFLRTALCCAAALAIASPLLLSGCHNFFVCEKASCPTNPTPPTPTTGTNYAYVSNSSSGSTFLAAYNIGKGALTPISGSPFNLGYVPAALTVSPSNSFLYIATLPGASNPGIFLYNIGSDGSLTIANGGQPLVADQISSMDISPDGNFLFTINSSGLTMNEYKVNTSNGTLTFALSAVLPGLGCVLSLNPATQSCTVKVSPSGAFVVAALGTQGDAIFPYTSTNGLTSTAFSQILPAATSADFSVALDKNNFAYIARTAALAVYSIDASGNPVQQANASYSNSAAPRSVVLGSNFNYVYTANQGTSNISEFGISSGGTLTQLSGSPVAGPSTVSALGVDRTGAYLVAAGYNSTSGIQLYTIGSNGVLSPTASAGSGTSALVPAVLAMTR